MKRRAFISSQFYIYTITGPYPYHVANAKAKEVDEVNWRYIIERDFEEKTLKKWPVKNNWNEPFLERQP